MKQTLAAFLVGLLFGLGLIVAGMTNPAKVIGFLDFFGAWDPSLAFVMGGALAVTAAGYRFALARPEPLLAAAFHLPAKTQIDIRLVSGAVLFGMGWGLAGLCPGPALTGIGTLNPDVLAFCASMVIGAFLFRILDRMAAKGRPLPS